MHTIALNWPVIFWLVGVLWFCFKKENIILQFWIKFRYSIHGIAAPIAVRIHFSYLGELVLHQNAVKVVVVFTEQWQLGLS